MYVHTGTITLVLCVHNKYIYPYLYIYIYPYLYIGLGLYRVINIAIFKTLRRLDTT